MQFILVGAGGFIGAIARFGIYLLERSWGNQSFPLGTLAINSAGCFLAGLLLAVAERDLNAHRDLLLFATMGFVGSFTTFSTFGLETFSLLRQGSPWIALVNVGANLLLGLTALSLGKWLLS